MRSIADVNVLLPLLCEGHPAQPAALQWFDHQPARSVGWCLLTRLAILRHLTNPRIMGADVQPSAGALAAWEQLERDERMFGITSVPPLHERWFRTFASARRSRSNLWTDAWLAALAETAGLEMVTFDQGFKDFPMSHLRLLEVSP
jgi:toxin-antitoxin system PIN domain toxin